MSGDNGNQNIPGHQLWLRDRTMVTAEEYRLNQQQIANARQALALMEQENEEKHRRFLLAQQELQRRVEEGREAERLLAQMQAQTQGQAAQAPRLTNGSSSRSVPASYLAQAGGETVFTSGEAVMVPGSASHYPYPVGGSGGNPASGQSYSRNYVTIPPLNDAHGQVSYDQMASTSNAGDPRYSGYAYHDRLRDAQLQQAQQQPPAPATGSSRYYRPTYERPPSAQEYPPQQIPATAQSVHQPTRQSTQQHVPVASQQPPGQAHQRSGGQASSTSHRPEVANVGIAGGRRHSQSSAQQPVASSSAAGATKPAPAAQADPRDARKALEQEMRRRFTALEHDLRELLMPLDHTRILLLSRIVLNRLSDKLVTANGAQAFIPSLKGWEGQITPDLERLAETLVPRLKHWDGRSIVNVLHRVQTAKREAESAATATTSSGQNAPTPAVEPLPSSSSSVTNAQAASSVPPPVPVGFSSFQVSQPVSQSTTSHPTVVPPPSSSPYSAPSQQTTARPPTSAAAPPSSTPNRDPAPSISFANLPQTPQSTGHASQRVLTPANPSHLARDILRSLGRPSSQFLAKASSAVPASAEPSPAGAKRKRSPPADDNADKRQKTGEVQPVPEKEAPPAAIAPPSVSAAPMEAPARPIPNPEPAPPAPVEVAPQAEPPAELPAPSIAHSDRAAALEEPEEISTPGALEMALNNAISAIHQLHPSALQQSLVSDGAASSPADVSASSPADVSASLPPTSGSVSRGSEPARAGEDVQMRDAPRTFDIPVLDRPVRARDQPDLLSRRSYGDVPIAYTADSASAIHANAGEDTVGSGGAEVQHTGDAPATAISIPSSSSSAPATPVAGPSKQPLFYVSPGSSSDGFPAHDADFDGGMPAFIPSGLLGGDELPPARSPSKGKGRAYEVDSDVEVVDQVRVKLDRRKQRVLDSDDEVQLLALDSEVEEDDDDEKRQGRAKAWGRAPQVRAYVLVPPPSEALRRILEARRSTAASEEREVSPDESEDEIAEDFRDAETKHKEAAEARAVHDLCYNRLTAYRCHWGKCNAVLESAKRLGMHAKTHIIEYRDARAPFVCQWQGCPREYRSREGLAHHVQKHSLHPVVCAYAGCEYECWSAQDMVMHVNQPRHRGQPLKPEAHLLPPIEDMHLPPLPETLPSFLCLPRPVRPHRISEALHASLGPKVANNISSYTPVSETTLRTPRRPKLSDKLAASLESGEISATLGAYAHWLSSPTKRTRVRRLCSDMPSKLVTNMFSDAAMVIDADWLARGEPAHWDPADYAGEDAGDGASETGDELPRSQEDVKMEDELQRSFGEMEVEDGQGERAELGDAAGTRDGEGARERDTPDALPAAEGAPGDASRLLDDESPPGWVVLPGASEGDVDTSDPA